MVWACSWRPSRSRGPEWDKWQDRLKLGTDYPSALVATITWERTEDEMNEPRTASGRDLLEVLSFRSRRRWGTLVWVDSVLRIEAEACEATLNELRREVEALDDHACREAVLTFIASSSKPGADRTRS